METWTRQELEELYPDGTVSAQEDDEVRLMTHEEWDAWIEGQVGTNKIDPIFGSPEIDPTFESPE